MLSFLAIVKNVNTNAQKIVDNNHHNALEKSLTLQIRRENRLYCGVTSDLNAQLGNTASFIISTALQIVPTSLI